MEAYVSPREVSKHSLGPDSDNAVVMGQSVLFFSTITQAHRASKGLRLLASSIQTH